MTVLNFTKISNIKECNTNKTTQQNKHLLDKMKIVSVALFLCVLSSIRTTPLKPVTIKQQIKGTLGNNAARIIGGATAVSSQFPFMVAIGVTKSDGRYFCSGTLWGTQWVITAGQCVQDGVLFTLDFGSHHLTAEDPNRKTASTSNGFLHPDFDPDTLDNDIALIKLRLPLQHTDYIKSIDKLPDADVGLNHTLAVTAVGWGQTSDTDAELAEELQYVNLVSIPNPECQTIYGDQVTDNMICVAGNSNEGACTGDTGSPLVQYVRPGWIIQFGVSSFHSQRGCETSDPSGYTRTYPYKEWIVDTAGSAV